MKRSSLSFSALVLALVINITSNTAQTYASLRVGVNSGKWRTAVDGIKKYNDNSEFLIYPLFSLPIEFGISKKWMFQVEPSFIQKGARIDYVLNSDIYNDCRLTVAYIELPMLAKLYFDEKKTRFHFFFGPSFGYATYGTIKRKGDFNVSLTKPPISKKVDEKLSFETDQYPRSDMSIVVGFGNYLNYGGFDVRYVFGLRNLGIKGDGNAKYYNHGIQLSFVYCDAKSRKKE